MNKYGSVLLALCLLLAFAAGDSATAATTGKMTGTVRDAASGEPLPGVNVVLEGMNRGATTDTEGIYLILAVDPGEYTIKASMVGFAAATKSDVRVVADYTSTVDFTLKEATLEMSEVVVVATRPAVEPDKTTSKHVITLAEIEAVPMVRSSTDLISLQPGMALDGANKIRGSEPDGALGTVVGYYIDGIDVGRGGFSDVNTSAIQEVAVLTGGMNAEFGNALAGVVTLVTREGQQGYSGKLEYQLTPPGKRHWTENYYENSFHKDKIKWNDPDWVNETYADNDHPGPDGVFNTADDDDKVHTKTDYTGHAGHRVEANLSGPLVETLSFFASTAYGKGGRTFPSAEPTDMFNTRNLATLTFRPSGNLKVKVGGLYESHKDYYSVVSSGDGSAWEGSIKGTGASGRNVFLPENWAASGKRKYTDDMFHLTLTHSLGAKTYYEARIYTVGSKADCYDYPDDTEPIITDKGGWFYLPRKIMAYNDSYLRRYGLKFDFTSQISRSHLMQAGFEVKRHNYWFTYYREGTQPGYRVLQFAGKDYELGKAETPWDASLYLQDKLEYRGLVVNAGLRWDYFNYGRPWRQVVGIEISPMYSKFTHRQNELGHMESGTPTFTSLSPRVGISHPINEKLAAHYFIGRFHTILPMNEMFQMSYATQDPDRDVNGNGAIDPTEQWNAMDALTSFGLGGGRHATEGLHPEQSTSVEMGVDWNFVPDYTTSITAHYRLDEGLYGTNCIIYWKGPKKDTSQIGVLRNAWWTSARGIELSLNKAFSHNFSFQLAYDLSWEHGIGYSPARPHYGLYESNWYLIPDANFIASEHYWYQYAAQADGSETPVPLTPAEVVSLGEAADGILAHWRDDMAGTPYAEGYYSDPRQVNSAGLWVVGTSVGSEGAPRLHGRRNQLSLQFFYATPMDYGPRLGRIHPFGGLKMSTVYRVFSGNPFEYTPPDGPSEWQFESPSMRTDLHLQKDFPKLGGIRPALFVEVTNLFNEKNDEENDFQFVQYGMKGSTPDSPDYLNYGDTGEWSRYRWDPRLIQVGLTLSF